MTKVYKESNIQVVNKKRINPFSDNQLSRTQNIKCSEILSWEKSVMFLVLTRKGLLAFPVLLNMIFF